VSGKHGLGSGLNYNMLLEVPREYLRQNAITGIIESELSNLEKEASKIGLNLAQGEFLLINIIMKGSINDPTFIVKPVGTSSKKIEDMAADELERKEEEIKDKINEKVDSTIAAVTDTLFGKSKEIQDSLKKIVNDKVGAFKDSITSQVDTMIRGILDSLGSSGIENPGTISPIDLLKNNSSKEINDIKKELEKWNRLKKKKKTG